MTFYEPRSFPPPSLTGVPVDYIIDQLHELAPVYWDNANTSDCTIVIPVPHHRSRLFQEELDPLIGPTPSYDTAGRRATESCITVPPRLTMNLHTEYLFAHSIFLRVLFSDASPIDLIQPNPPSCFRTPSGNYTIPHDRLPHLMPSSTSQHPILYLPVPDPSSIHLIFLWMYFGDTEPIHDALARRVIEWEGIARNVEYLGLSSDLRLFLGRWYAKWIRPATAQPVAEETESDEGSYDSADSDGTLNGNISNDLDAEEHMDGQNESRGRNRATRCLSWASTHSLAAASHE